MKQCITSTLACLIVLSQVASAQRAEPPKEPLVEKVRRSIGRGIQYFRDLEQGRGDWEIDKGSVGHKGGHTCMVLLALLNSGVKTDDPMIVRGLKYLRGLESTQTYVVSLQTMVFAEAGRSEDRERIQRNVNWLLTTRVVEGDRLKGWSYGNIRSPNLPGDNSNTQYALLGLHAGHLAGAKIDREVWLQIREFYIRTQQADGGWVYNMALSQSRTLLTMSTAGLCGLLIAGMELNDGREELLGDGSARNCGVYEENKPVANALGYVGTRFRINVDRNVYYNLYGLERAGRISGLRFFGNQDWYRKGCEYLVENQREDGSWIGANDHGGSPVVCTSFALLFLSKGRMPVLVSKLVHGPGEDWNNDRHDARNLVEYAARELFHRQPLAWQIFDARRVEARNNEEFARELLEPLLQSPVVYFNGHEAPRFTDVEKKLLKEYIDQGGFIFAEACCGRPGFDQGIRQLLRELFPDSPLKVLSPEHPIWRAHALVPPTEFKLEGIELGCKTVVVYSPQDLSCWWESNQVQSGRGQLAFRLGGNIIAYATGMEPPKPRLTPSELIKKEEDGKVIPRGFLKVAQLRHDGDWQPAPRAMQNLMVHLREKARLDVALQTEILRPSHPDLVDFKLLYMHGRSKFTFGDEEIKNLRADLETGGLLLADACCGKQAFDSAFRTFVAKLMPDKRLEPIALNDDLYSKELNGSAIAAVRCRTEASARPGQPAEFRDMPPYLEGIKLNNRWVVIYSKYDIGCALEKHQSTDCLGHDYPSALRLGSAVVLYALRR